MSQNEELNQLIEAILIQYSPQTDQETRIKAHELTESFKEAKNLELSVELFRSHENGPYVRYFALQSIEYMIRNCWESDQELRTPLRQSVTFLFTATKPLIEEEQFIKEKVASLVSEIAKREWPKGWPEMIDELVEIGTQSETQCELSLIFIRSFSEELFIYVEAKDLGARRRLELKNSMKREIPKVIETLIAPAFERFYLTLNDSNENMVRISQKMINICLRACASLFSWVNPQIVYKYRLLIAICQLLNHLDFREIAADSLSLFSQRRLEERGRIRTRNKKSQTNKGNSNKYSKNNSNKNSLTLVKKEKEQISMLIETLYEFYQERFVSDQNSLNFEKTLARSVASLFQAFAPELVFPSQNQDSLNFSKKFFQIPLYLSSHESLSISMSIISFWCFLFAPPPANPKKKSLKSKHINNNFNHAIVRLGPLADEIVVKVLEKVWEKYISLESIIQLGFDNIINRSNNNNQSLISEYIREDFADSIELEEFIDEYRSKLYLLCRGLAARRPAYALETLINGMTALLNEEPNTTQNEEKTYLDEDGILTEHHPLICKFKAILYLARGIVAGLERVKRTSSNSKNSFLKKPVMDLIIPLLELLCEYPSNQPLLISSVCECLLCFDWYYTNNEQISKVVIDKLFALLTYKNEIEKQNNTPLDKLSQKSLKVRISASTGFAQLMHSVPKKFSNLLEPLYTATKEMLDNHLVRDSEKPSLCQAVIELSNKNDLFNAQSVIVENFCEEPITILLSEDFTNIIQDPEQFLNFIGIINLSNEESQLRSQSNRANLYNILELIMNVLSSVKRLSSFARTDNEVKELIIEKYQEKYNNNGNFNNNNNNKNGKGRGRGKRRGRGRGRGKNQNQKKLNDLDYILQNEKYPNPLFIQYFTSILPSLGAIINSLNLLFTDEIRNVLPEESVPILNPLRVAELKTKIFQYEIDELTHIVKKEQIKEFLLHGIVPENHSPIKIFQISLSYWIYLIRKQIYKLLQHGCKTQSSDFYLIPGLNEFIVNSILSNENFINPIDFSFIIEEVLSPYYLNTPLEEFKSILIPIYPSIFQLFINRLKTIWPSFSQIDNQGNENDYETQCLDEIIGDEMILEFTYSVLKFLDQIFKKSAAKNNNSTKNLSICDLTLNHKRLINPIFEILEILIQVPDSLSLDRAIRILNKIIPLIFNQKFFDFIYNNLLTTAISALTQKKTENEIKLLLSLIYKIYTVGGNQYFKKFFSILQNLQNIATEDINKLRNELKRNAGFKSSRLAIRSFLEIAVGHSLFGSKKTRIQDSTSKLVPSNQKKAARRRGFIKGQKKKKYKRKKRKKGKK
ncbi:exportin-5 [Anaeramoeba flamelloides]|uniref:Exportin-5 n=1 Tax=Anaeramoeba flamelloides TaxID=1746091 RepID=A0ABQ8YS41_9EUKA|nr:exportin-5 [Anaeramoeba flamelloides]